MILNQCQFTGALGEDVNDHIDTFLGICELFKIKDVDIDAIKLRVFPFTLTGTDKEWLKSNAPGFITTWDQMQERLLARFFPHALSKKLLSEITNYVQILAGGTIMHKSPNEAYKLIKDIAVHTYEWYAPQDRMAMFNKKFDKLNATVVAMQVGCESYSGPHLTRDCDDNPMSSSEDASWVNQRQGRYKKEKEAEQYSMFLDLFKQLHINLPFVEALSQMPKYEKFLKDLLTNKKKLEDLSTVIMSEECFAVFDGKLPKKMFDPGRFTIPFLIGNLSVHNALADLRASINLMPNSMYTNLGLGEPKPILDFVILDMDEDSKVPLVIGQPFLSTSHCLVDVYKKKMTLRRGDINMSNEEVLEELAYLIENDPSSRSNKEEEIKNGTVGKPKTSFEEPLVLKLKDLLPHLEYAFLKSESKLPIVISSDLTGNEKEKIIEEKLVNAPIMVAPDWNLPFELMCDESNYAVGAVLGQQRENKF
nr:hypothetical protein [Tanacetum cinerariifolium]